MSEGGSGGRGRIDGMHWSTVVSTASAGVGLILTAVVTCFGVLTAQDQLDQAREQSEEKLQEQAGRVTSWAVREKNGDLMQVVANRSLDPVLGAFVYAPTGRKWDAQEKRNRFVYGVTRTGQIPPCLSVKIGPIETVSEGLSHLVFVDSSGRTWKREDTGKLVQVEPGYNGTQGPLLKGWKTEKLADCG
ncbi:hypothetical protein [Streptomyces sp. NPDC056468]|uniref:hypothetical protein n=1 Tax=Streptomyces sp. NPDC056468 TaxID=3345830 RepID=UPI0036BC4E72